MTQFSWVRNTRQVALKFRKDLQWFWSTVRLKNCWDRVGSLPEDRIQNIAGWAREGGDRHSSVLRGKRHELLGKMDGETGWGIMKGNRHQVPGRSAGVEWAYTNKGPPAGKPETAPTFFSQRFLPSLVEGSNLFITHAISVLLTKTQRSSISSLFLLTKYQKQMELPDSMGSNSRPRIKTGIKTCISLTQYFQK